MKKFLIVSLICFLNTNLVSPNYTEKFSESRDNKFEENFRQKYKNLHIPNIKFNQGGSTFGYRSNCNAILIPTGKVPLSSKNEEEKLFFEWTLLRQVGHAQDPLAGVRMTGASLFVFLTSFLHTKRLYPLPSRISFTKLASTSFPGIIGSFVTFSVISSGNELQADRFANKHVNKETLAVVLKNFESTEEDRCFKVFPEKNPYIFRKVIGKIIDFTQPPVDIRILNIESELNKRPYIAPKQ